MKHKWELLTPGSGPLVATSNLRAPVRYQVGWRLHCSRCEKHLTIPYDVLDTYRIVDFIEKQEKRNDCSKAL